MRRAKGRRGAARQRPGRVMFVQPVAERGGSDQALLRMVRHLAAEGWRCDVVLPGPGPLDDAFRDAGAALHVVPMRRISTSNSVGDWTRYALAWPLSVGRLVVLGRRLEV